ncbi:type II toxin-antitoxin system VapC family toxin [soil metagenome]
MLVDANLLLYAVDRSSHFHHGARGWLSTVLAAERRVGLPWPSLTAFLRIATHPRAVRNPLTPYEAWQHVQEWLAAEPAWVPTPTARHAEILGDLISRYQLSGNLIPDADIAALAIEHGLSICSADTDFARFSEVRWVNPLQ